MGPLFLWAIMWASKLLLDDCWTSWHAKACCGEEWTSHRLFTTFCYVVCWGYRCCCTSSLFKHSCLCLASFTDMQAQTPLSQHEEVANILSLDILPGILFCWLPILRKGGDFREDFPDAFRGFLLKACEIDQPAVITWLNFTAVTVKPWTFWHGFPDFDNSLIYGLSLASPISSFGYIGDKWQATFTPMMLN